MPSDLARRKRPETAGHRPTAAVRVGITAALAVVVLLAVIALPAFALDGGDDDGERTGAAPSTSTSTTSTTAPSSPPTTAAVDALTAAFASFSDQDLLALKLFSMSDAEREAFARFIAPPPPAPAPAPAPEPAPVEVEVVPVEPAPVEAAPAGSVWDEIAYCETGGNWAHPPVGSYGYSGGLMFLPSTWNAYGGGEFASQAYLASRDAQIVVAERILADHGGSYRAWPGCRAKLGLP